jgi:hypothetical protein
MTTTELQKGDFVTLNPNIWNATTIDYFGKGVVVDVINRENKNKNGAYVYWLSEKTIFKLRHVLLNDLKKI